MRIGTTFVILGIALLATAPVLYLRADQPWWGTLAWPASSFLAVGAAYLHLGPGLFGKRMDGTLPGLRVVALLPFFALTWMAWRLLRLRSGDAYHTAAPGLYIGRRPIADELPDDVRWVVDLTAEFPRSVPPSSAARYETLPILDGHVPSEDALVDLARRIAGSEDPVYVHCAQGHGRAAMVTAAVMLARGLASSASGAEQALKTLRPGVRLTPAQRGLLQRVQGRLK